MRILTNVTELSLQQNRVVKKPLSSDSTYLKTLNLKVVDYIHAISLSFRKLGKCYNMC